MVVQLLSVHKIYGNLARIIHQKKFRWKDVEGREAEDGSGGDTR